jgi:acetyl-CoA acetyltransferase
MSAAKPAAIAGLGITEMTRAWIGDAATIAVRAVRLALEDAGLQKTDLDGLLINAGTVGTGIMGSGGGPGSLGIDLHTKMGLRDLKLLCHMIGWGSTAGQMVQYAALAVEKGICSAVACVFADAPLTGRISAGLAYAGGQGDWKPPRGMAGLTSHYGFFGANSFYAMAARRHMALYGTTSEQLGAVAVSNHKWSSLNPRAVYRTPITMDDYNNSRWVVEPFHLFDVTMVNNGGVAVIVTSGERAADLRQPPVYILGMGQGHPGNPHRAGYENEVNTGARIAKDSAFRQAGITTDDVDLCELYDCYTYTTLVTLEDYGFCKKGEGGPFVADGKLEPGGALPTNTGGGQLAGYYMWGMTPISEAVVQARGQGGERQVPKHDVVLTSAQGGILDMHATLVLSPHASVR